MSEWLAACGCTHVAMESTGVYWKPVWHVLEGHFELVLANAMYIRNIPGRKSDVKDAVWIADLLPHELAGPIATMIDAGMADTKRTLEKAPRGA